MYSKCELKFIVERLKFSVTVENTFTITIETKLTENMLHLYCNQFRNTIKEIIGKIIFSLFRIIVGPTGNSLWIPIILRRIPVSFLNL